MTTLSDDNIQAPRGRPESFTRRRTPTIADPSNSHQGQNTSSDDTSPLRLTISRCRIATPHVTFHEESAQHTYAAEHAQQGECQHTCTARSELEHSATGKYEIGNQQTYSEPYSESARSEYAVCVPHKFQPQRSALHIARNLVPGEFLYEHQTFPAMHYHLDEFVKEIEQAQYYQSHQQITIHNNHT